MSTFVKHPDTSEMLPAEASGRMRPGDQLVDINGHGVEGLNAEEATALIRQVCERESGRRGRRRKTARSRTISDRLRLWHCSMVVGKTSLVVISEDTDHSLC